MQTHRGFCHMMRLLGPILTLSCLLSLWDTAHAAEIAVLKSADLPYYERAIAGFKA